MGLNDLVIRGDKELEFDDLAVGRDEELTKSPPLRGSEGVRVGRNEDVGLGRS